MLYWFLWFCIDLVDICKIVMCIAKTSKKCTTLCEVFWFFACIIVLDDIALKYELLYMIVHECMWTLTILDVNHLMSCTCSVFYINNTICIKSMNTSHISHWCCLCCYWICFAESLENVDNHFLKCSYVLMLNIYLSIYMYIYIYIYGFMYNTYTHAH